MGASMSQAPRQAQMVQQGTNHGPIPEDQVPYNGPTHEYRVLQVDSKLKATMSFGFTAGQQVATSDISSYYGTLQQQYAEYYKMNTFFQVPMAVSQSGFTSAHVPFQGKN